MRSPRRSNAKASGKSGRGGGWLLPLLLLSPALVLLIALGAALRGTAIEAERPLIRDTDGRARVVIGQAVPRVPGQPAAVAAPAPPEFGLFIYGEGDRWIVNLMAAGREKDDSASLNMMSPDETVESNLS